MSTGEVLIGIQSASVSKALTPNLRRVTFDRTEDQGSPRSRANAHVIREAVVTKPTAENIIATITIETLRRMSSHVDLERYMFLTIAIVPSSEWVAFAKTSINGNPVLVSRADFSLPRQTNTAMVIAKPRRPFRATETSILLGTTLEGSAISSAVVGHYQQGSMSEALYTPYPYALPRQGL